MRARAHPGRVAGDQWRLQQNNDECGEKEEQSEEPVAGEWAALGLSDVPRDAREA
jgi:hypothetical protein